MVIFDATPFETGVVFYAYDTNERRGGPAHLRPVAADSRSPQRYGAAAT